MISLSDLSLPSMKMSHMWYYKPTDSPNQQIWPQPFIYIALSENIVYTTYLTYHILYIVPEQWTGYESSLHYGTLLTKCRTINNKAQSG